MCSQALAGMQLRDTDGGLHLKMVGSPGDLLELTTQALASLASNGESPENVLNYVTMRVTDTLANSHKKIIKMKGWDANVPE